MKINFLTYYLLTATSFLLTLSVNFSFAELKDKENSKSDINLDEDFTLYKKIELKGRLAFTAEIKGSNQAIEVDLNSGKFKLLFPDLNNSSSVSYNPNGDKLVYVSAKDNIPSIYISDWDGRNQKKLTKSNLIEGDPSFHPDIEKPLITFYRYLENNKPNKKNSAIILHDLNSNKEKQLTFSNNRNITPIFSTDGKQIAFSTDAFWPGWDICVVNIDNRIQQCLLKGIDSYFRPYYHPKLKAMAYAYGSANSVRIGLLTLTNESRKTLVKIDGKSYDPHYDPEGELLFFANDKSGSFDIYIQTSEEVMPLITSTYPLRHPAYHPTSTMEQEVKRIKDKAR